VAIAALVAGVPAVLAGSYASITPDAIAGANVGLTHAAYRSIFGKPVLVEQLENDYSRLVFTKPKVEVYFHGSVDAGVAVGTWNRAHRTASGIGPCSTVHALKSAYRGRLTRVVVGRSFAGYRLGRLVFAIAPGQPGEIGAISLVSSSTPLFVAIATAARTGPCPPANLIATPAVKFALRAAFLAEHRQYAPSDVDGPIKGRTYFGRYRGIEYALAVFSVPGTGTTDQPELFRRPAGGRWRDLGDTGGTVCPPWIPLPLLKTWEFVAAGYSVVAGKRVRCYAAP
jgi:hypothetical protein